MKKFQHPSNNGVLGAPAGWVQSDVPCGALPITRTVVDGVAVVISYWKPTAEELALLNAGAPVALSIVGTSMPPVALDVDPG